MLVVLHSSPVAKVTRDGCVVILPMSEVLPPETVEVKTTAEVLSAFEVWKDKVKATGKPACVSLFKHPRCKARKPNGFDRATRRHVYVNLEAAKTEAA